MPRSRPPYAPEFRRRMIELVRAGRAPEAMVKRLNLTMVGWANYFSLGHVGPAYKAVNRHVVRRLRQWLGRKYETKSGNIVRIPVARLQQDYGLTSLTRQTLGLSRAKACSRPKAGCGSSARPV